MRSLFYILLLRAITIVAASSEEALRRGPDDFARMIERAAGLRPEQKAQPPRSAEWWSVTEAISAGAFPPVDAATRVWLAVRFRLPATWQGVTAHMGTPLPSTS
jgi:hypothetical protein